MIKADLHLHTCFSHGKPTPFEVHVRATKKGYAVIGFSEHSPRPAGYDYSNEYREQLESHLQDYKNQVLTLKRNAAQNPESCQALFGMEMDWLSGREDFVTAASRAFDFDYLLGSVHFIGRWGFDDNKKDWADLSQEEAENFYGQYFDIWLQMLKSGLFNIAAHPDLIKIFSIERFRIWLDKPNSREIVKNCLKTLKNSGMAMEVSSAGLRKPCLEIYPGPQIMQMAAELKIPVALASDAHNLEDFAFAFDKLENYAKSFGFVSQAIFDHGKMRSLAF